MNLREAMITAAKQIDEDELPASESSRLLNEILHNETVTDCPGDGCGIVEVCENEPVIGLNEPF